MDGTQRPDIELREQEPPKRRNVKRPETVDSHERGRDFLGEVEISRLLAAARKGRFGSRDHTMLLLMYRHGLRVSELISTRRDAIDYDSGRIWVKRKKSGLSTHQPLAGEELRAIKAYEVLEAQGYSVTQLALSGKAVKRMMEATGRPALTLASFIKKMRDAENRGEVNVNSRVALVIDDSRSASSNRMRQRWGPLARTCFSNNQKTRWFSAPRVKWPARSTR